MGEAALNRPIMSLYDGEAMFERGQKILNKLKADGRTQVWLIRQIEARGIHIYSPQFMSNVLHGKYTLKRGREIMDAAEEILGLK